MVQNVHMTRNHNDHEHEPIIFPEILNDCFMGQQEYLMSFITKFKERTVLFVKINGLSSKYYKSYVRNNNHHKVQNIQEHHNVSQNI